MEPRLELARARVDKLAFDNELLRGNYVSRETLDGATPHQR